MKIILSFLLLLSLTLSSFSQIEEPPVDEPVEEPIVQFAEKMPEYPGGQQAMNRFIASNVRYPDSLIEQGIQGRVFVQFIVQKDGSLSDIKILKSPHQAMSDEVIRIVKKMPKWTPGQQRGKAIRVRMNLPVLFSLK